MLQHVQEDATVVYLIMHTEPVCKKTHLPADIHVSPQSARAAGTIPSNPAGAGSLPDSLFHALSLGPAQALFSGMRGGRVTDMQVNSLMPGQLRNHTGC